MKLSRFGILFFIFMVLFSIKAEGKEIRFLSEKLELTVEETCKEYEMDKNLVKGVLFLESRYNINCITHNYDKKGNIVSTDQGIGQINDKYKEFYGKLAGIEEPDSFNPIHNIKMTVAGLNYWRKTAENEGYEGEELILVTLNSYNAGFNGYMEYIRKHNTMERAYSNRVLEFKAMIDEYGYIEE